MLFVSLDTIFETLKQERGEQRRQIIANKRTKGGEKHAWSKRSLEMAPTSAKLRMSNSLHKRAAHISSPNLYRCIKQRTAGSDGVRRVGL
jgi:hypothetical protein